VRSIYCYHYYEKNEWEKNKQKTIKKKRKKTFLDSKQSDECIDISIIYVDTGILVKKLLRSITLRVVTKLILGGNGI